ncbi:MAG: flagellar hook-length control protein FliK [Treponema sp.]|nr:flagellar hook-length control protein FliK [Treponema sp.]
MIAIADYTAPVAQTELESVKKHEEAAPLDSEDYPVGFAEILAGLMNVQAVNPDQSDVKINFPGNLSGNTEDINFDVSDILLSNESHSGLIGIVQTEGLSLEMSAEKTGELELSFEKAKTHKDVFSLAKENVNKQGMEIKPEVIEAAKQIIEEKKPENTQELRQFAKIEKAALENSLFNVKTGTEFSHNGQLPGQKENLAGEKDRLVVKSSKQSLSRLDEFRSRRDKVSFEIRDNRTFTDAPRVLNTVNQAPVKEIIMEVRLGDSSVQNAQTTWDVKPAPVNFSSALENMLARELHNNLNGDIVRHASMALRDGGEATIKLALRPESLGNVKIRLEMTENKITGYILVDSEEAMNAFKKELASLEQAFKEFGFADANLDLSLASEDKNDWQELQMAASSYETRSNDAEAETIALSDFLDRLGSINMLA